MGPTERNTNAVQITVKEKEEHHFRIHHSNLRNTGLFHQNYPTVI